MLRRILFLAAVVAIAPGCSTVKGWFGGSRGGKATQPAKLTEIASPIAVTRVWTAKLGGGEGRGWLRQHPTFANGRVYATDGAGNLVALDASTGKELWAANAVERAAARSKLKFWNREKTETAALSGSPGVGNGLVIVGGRNGEVVAFSESGEKKWTARVTSEVLSAPLITPTRVIVRANDGRVFGLDPADGTRKWVFDRGLPTLTVRGNATPIGGNGVAFVGYDDGSLVAIREDDGQRVWEQIVAEPDGRTELQRMADLDGEIMLDGDTLFVVSYHDRVMALSAASGQPMWAHDVGGYSGAALSADKVLLSDKVGNVWALNRSTGDSLWKQNLFENRQLTTPVVHGDYVVVGDLEGYLHWLKLETGDLAGRVRLQGAPLRGTPQIAPDGTLYAISSKGELGAYRLGNSAMLPLVALVGRPNVGKSTLFNALTRTRDALVHDEPGVTRDRQYGLCRLEEGRPFVVCDTGGLTDESEGLAAATTKQSRAAASEADVILFIVDGREGLNAADEAILRWLRKTGRPLYLVVNKTDGLDVAACVNEFARMGVDMVIPIAAAHQRGVPELVQALLPRLPADRDTALLAEEPERTRIAFIGRPNVGKSTLVNRLLGEERVIASEVPGTTRDSIAVDLERDGRKYRLIDTAGLRRRSKVEEAVEIFSTFKTLQAIESSQVVVVMLDAGEGVTEQDATVLGHVLDSGRALVIAVNKWDGQSTYQRDQTRALLDRKLAFCTWAEQVTISAKHGTGMRELFNAVKRAHASATRNFGTAEVTRALEAAVTAFPPPVQRGHVAKLKFGHPGGENPPLFVVHGTRLKGLPDSYRRYLENFFRKRFKLVGTPVRFIFKEGENPYEGKKNPLSDRQVAKKRRLLRHVKGK